jgi:hypothetical protein
VELRHNTHILAINLVLWRLDNLSDRAIEIKLHNVGQITNSLLNYGLLLLNLLWQQNLVGLLILVRLQVLYQLLFDLMLDALPHRLEDLG